MSIYGSFAVYDGEPYDHPAPMIYRGSHVLPNPDDPRGGSLDLGYIPGFITRDGRHRLAEPDPECDDEGVWPWLRVSLRPTDDAWADGEDTVVLDRDQVAALRDDLTDWLLRCDDLDAWLSTHGVGGAS